MIDSVLNARMRRIDLFCKLVGPLVISLIAGASTIIAIWATLGMSITSVLIEYLCIDKVRASFQISASKYSIDSFRSTSLPLNCVVLKTIV